ncbi:GDSL-type esterase/lipase family protein [Luteimicrobium subarcticum]|uniref:GDSL-like lipase/acylhydrolase family protein n=1 Tax=Luteimicrobium subarcticum TaxID=620910 RepID=A0A2M8WWH2_9MICO|nr:GDSL-type esterase/lipase family protein [Luteimicrobium subarcticum]PJI95226.1 GDSL-like lipase/acylhydrolase family protein [Luteimicrobium subarcticum]
MTQTNGWSANGPERTELRICVVGDELVAGVGDARGLGWTGRVLARTRFDGTTLLMTLPIPREPSTALGERWQAETARRFSPEPTVDNRLVVALGRHDLDTGLSLARSRLNLANVLDVAEQQRTPAFVVGPPPGSPEENGRLGELSAAYADVAGRRRVPYVDTFSPLVGHEQWLADLASAGTGLPGQAGYGLIAWLVLHTGWHSWLGLPDPTV